METVHLRAIDEVNMKIETDAGTLMEIADAFTFFADNYKFSPKYKARIWDGKISLVNRYTGIVYRGLAHRVKKFCDNRNYKVTFCDNMIYDNVHENEVKEHLEKITPKHIEYRQYQFDSILKCLRSKRRTLESPTSSGKSYMIYALSTWYSNEKSLLIVPSIGLVEQMAADFIEYGYKGVIHKSTDGLSKSNDIPADVVITTWQSLNNGKTKMPESWYQQFGVVFGDECHGYKATCLIQIMKSLKNCKYRFGTTGTLDDNTLNTYTIEGLFGPRYKSTSTRELIDAGYASKLKIKCIVLTYSEADKKAAKGLDYHQEIDFLVNHKGRTNYIKNLVLSLSGNKLLFFKKIDHGQILYNAILSGKKEKDSVFLIDGSVDKDDRERIRLALENEDNSTLVASLGTTSTGVSIKKLMRMIVAAPSKGKIKILQSIGRMLRQHKEKEMAVVYDIIDDLSNGKKENYTLKHFRERLKIYENEEFDYEIYNVKLK